MIRSSLMSEAIFVMEVDQSMMSPSSSSHTGYCSDQPPREDYGWPMMIHLFSLSNFSITLGRLLFIIWNNKSCFIKLPWFIIK